MVESTNEEGNDIVIEAGVWAVWTDPGREHLYIIFPADHELDARRWSDEFGAGWVEFIRFGEEQ